MSDYTQWVDDSKLNDLQKEIKQTEQIRLVSRQSSTLLLELSREVFRPDAMRCLPWLQSLVASFLNKLFKKFVILWVRK